ncbi:NAD(P)-binding protein [Microthyrium microscopicum]|uniref:NAD(P)-binding protein n=1 Tax=Microthyrium microscopicum TaxID=703497 RepID=A0A6A6TWT5_9PEZI|nr:NAD(P)-binding protein [Microthyrium microscopicum]
MQPPFPAPVTEWHRDTYDAINPTRPELSQKGKTIVITGGGQGIGRETIDAFAQAGATNIHITGRTSKTLQESKVIHEKKYPGLSVTIHVADVADEAAMTAAAKEIGSWDVIVANAGFLPTPGTIEKSNLANWWSAFEIHVKGSAILAQAFLPSKKAGGTIIGTSSGAGFLPAPMPNMTNTSAYAASKIALSRVYEFIAAENPDLSVFNIQPGIVDTAMYKKSGMDFEEILDTVQLPAHFAVWLSSPEAKPFSGRFLFSNWDVTQLKEKVDRVKEDPFYLTTGLGGWPFAA